MNPRSFASALLVVGTLLVPRAHASAQTVTVSGDPFTLSVSQATPGSAPTAVLESSTTYSVTTASPGGTLRARLDVALPGGVQLKVTLTPPAGASGVGEVTLTTTDQDVVTNLPQGTFTGLGVTYRLVATTGAGVVPVSSRHVILTLVEPLRF